MKRSELKSLVKECLLEILVEGFGASASNLTESREEKKSSQSQNPQVRRPALDLIRTNDAGQNAGHQRRMPMGLGKRNIPNVRQENPDIYKNILGVDDSMASIFADTAATTLREQVSSESSLNRNSNPIVDTGVDPSMFEGSANWETLAFAESKRHQ